MRPAPHKGQNPRRLHENATSLLCAPLDTAHAQKAVGEDTALEKSVELVPDELRQRHAGLRLDLREESLSRYVVG